jgi:hypothetical protein
MTTNETESLLKDLVWLNAVIATELIQITENTSSILRKSAPPASCLADHKRLREIALSIAERCNPDVTLRTHLTGHE